MHSHLYALKQVLSNWRLGVKLCIIYYLLVFRKLPSDSNSSPVVHFLFMLANTRSLIQCSVPNSQTLFSLELNWAFLLQLCSPSLEHFAPPQKKTNSGHRDVILTPASFDCHQIWFSASRFWLETANQLCVVSDVTHWVTQIIVRPAGVTLVLISVEIFHNSPYCGWFLAVLRPTRAKLQA